jgi:tetratricopeptide (TPR) repeat protein
MNIKNWFLLMGLCALVACTRPQVSLQEKISVAENALDLDSTPIPSKNKATELIKMYLDYADNYKDDTLSPSYLFKAGEMSIAVGKFDQSIELFGRVQRYPNSNKTGSALFMQGFVAENHKQDVEQAKVFYQKFLEKYPDHVLANDCRMLLQQLSLSPEALIEMFEKQNGMTVSDSLPQ